MNHIGSNQPASQSTKDNDEYRRRRPLSIAHIPEIPKIQILARTNSKYVFKMPQVNKVVGSYIHTYEYILVYRERATPNTFRPTKRKKPQVHPNAVSVNARLRTESARCIHISS